MFIRYKTTPNSTKTSVQLVETFRKGNSVKQKVVRHIGCAINEEEKQALRKLGEQIMLNMQHETRPALFDKDSLMQRIVSAEQRDSEHSLIVNLKDIKEEKRIRKGIHQIYGLTYNEIGLDKIIKNPARKKASVAMLRHIVMTRIAQPSSKLHSVHLLDNEYGVKLDVNAVYRMMDLIDELTIEKIKNCSYAHTMGLFSATVDVIFYDCTTLYFESFIEDELKENGFSKDGKFNQSQVLLAVMVTENGLPVGYDLFNGGRFEGHTLEDALKRLHEKYQIGKVIFVADAALLSTDNIKIMQTNQQPFIVGARIKSMSKGDIAKILDRSDYKELYPEEKQEQPVTYKEIHLSDALRLIVTHSYLREAKDKHDREKALEQLNKRLKKSKNPKSLLSNYGYKKFVKIEGEATLIIDQDKIKEAAIWDGLHGIITNIQEPAKKLLAHYKGLWQIEETFRISKHDLKMRPIFHWTPKRIKAHIAICFMALVCMRSLEYKVRLQYKKISPAAIRYSLMKVEVSILKDYKTDKYYGLPSQVNQDAKKIYQICGLRLSDTPYLIKAPS